MAEETVPTDHRSLSRSTKRPSLRLAVLAAVLPASALFGTVAPAAASHDPSQSSTYVSATIPPDHRKGVGRSDFIESPAPEAGRWSFKVGAPSGKISSVTLQARLCTNNSHEDTTKRCYDPLGNSVSVKNPVGGEVLVTRKSLPAPGAEYAEYKYYYVKMSVQGTTGSSVSAHICPPPTATADCTFGSASG